MNDISPLHRLDKDTAGVMLLSVNPSSRACYHALFADRHIHKTYHAIAPTRSDLCYPFHIHFQTWAWRAVFLTKMTQGEPNAHTTIELIENNGAFSLYRLTLWQAETPIAGTYGKFKYAAVKWQFLSHCQAPRR